MLVLQVKVTRYSRQLCLWFDPRIRFLTPYLLQFFITSNIFLTIWSSLMRKLFLNGDILGFLVWVGSFSRTSPFTYFQRFRFYIMEGFFSSSGFGCDEWFHFILCLVKIRCNFYPYFWSFLDANSCISSYGGWTLILFWDSKDILFVDPATWFPYGILELWKGFCHHEGVRSSSKDWWTLSKNRSGWH